MEKITLYYTSNFIEASEAALRRAASHLTKEAESDFLIHRVRGKKPYFESHPDLHFSISHSGTLWICAFASTEIGCDIQIHREITRYDKLSKRWFHPNELKNVTYERDFYDIWSRKEAFVKAIGCGINRDFNKFDTTSGNAELDGISLQIFDFKLPVKEDLPDYSAAIAYPHINSLDFVCLDSI